MNKHFRLPGSLPLKLEELGVRPSAVLLRAGLRHDLFDQPRLLFTTEELFAVWRAIGELSPDPAIGLALGSETQLERLHPMALAALATANLGAAVSHVARYKQLTCPEDLVQEFDGDEWSLRFLWLLAAETEPPVFTEYCFAWMLTIARHGTGKRIAPVRLELMQSRSHVKAIERHFGCPVICGAPRNAIVFRAADTQAPFVTRNAELLAMLAPQLDHELKQGNGHCSFSELVGRAIRESLTGGRPSIEQIAAKLHISPRTLQRRLQDEGFSFQRILDGVRHQMARHYLGNSGLEMNEAAYLLGYEDASSFVRAFRIWEGIPPGHWRETYRASALPQPASIPARAKVGTTPNHCRVSGS